MSIEIVYRSNHPDVLAAWDDYIDANDTYFALVKSVAAELDPDGRGRDLVSVTGWIHGSAAYVVGLEAVDGDEDDPPPGWRFTWMEMKNGAIGVLQPNRRTKAGKAAARRLRDVKLAHPATPGMPRSVSRESGNGLRTHSAALGRYGDHVYAGWAVDPSQGPGEIGDFDTGLDTSMWEPCRLSEYHAAREAAQEKEALGG